MQKNKKKETKYPLNAINATEKEKFLKNGSKRSSKSLKSDILNLRGELELMGAETEVAAVMLMAACASACWKVLHSLAT